MTILKLGDQGDEVKKLQQALNKSGYKVNEDGIFGAETEEAVKHFNEGEGIGLSGNVDDKTWERLSHTVSSGKNYGTNNIGYKESDVVKQAQAALNAHASQKPGGYNFQWQAQLNDTIDKILSREKFSFDLNGDALYQQYKDKYIQQGKMAMGDAIGQASAMTGGYGNSYAQSVGQQMYQKELQNLNDVIPELYQMALDRDNQEKQDLYNQFAMLEDRESIDYGRYRDSMADWLAERDYLTNRYDNAIADEQWQKKVNADIAENSGALKGALLGALTGASGGAWWEKEQEPKTEPASYFETSLTDLKQMKAAGKSDKEAIDYLKDMLDEGLLTMSEYTSLYNKYRDNRLG